MSRARLHIICGNCGCSDDFEYRTFDQLIDDDMELTEGVHVRIACNNCATIHDLEDNAKEITKD